MGWSFPPYERGRLVKYEVFGMGEGEKDYIDKDNKDEKKEKKEKLTKEAKTEKAEVK